MILFDTSNKATLWGNQLAWDVGVRRPFLFLQHSCKHFTPHGLPGHENVN